MTQPPVASPSPASSLARRRYDVIVVGAGVAGLAFTLRLPPRLRVALLTKGTLGESNTRYAQGGLAAAVGPDDSPALHEADTLAAGAGLCGPAAVHRLVEDAPAAVDWLVALGTRFDADPNGTPLLGREAAHSRRRVLHAGGDATGAEIERALVSRVREDPAVDLFDNAFALDLLIAGGRCAGVVAQLAPGAPPVHLDAPLTVLAAGGAGQLWATTSNPPGATADALAMALRAGVAVADLEFVQFHPTVLALPGSTPFLVSEAVRGEGAYLRGPDGRRFMVDLHPLAELAPRDVVARGIQTQLLHHATDHVDLDLRHLDPDATRARFPTIARELAARGLDIARDLIPVAPAAHYFMGGIVAGPEGETSLPGLLALGEAACTGVHGANRLASNSLLEGLVFGLAAADALGRRSEVGGRRRAGTEEVMSGSASTEMQTVAAGLPAQPPSGCTYSLGDMSDLRTRLQRAMSQHVAVVRDATGLADAARLVVDIAAQLDTVGGPRLGQTVNGGAPASAQTGDDARTQETVRAVRELRNMTLAASAIITAATRREESRGAHFRSDFPDLDPSLDGRHLIYDGGDWRYGALAEALFAGTHAPG